MSKFIKISHTNMVMLIYSYFVRGEGGAPKYYQTQRQTLCDGSIQTLCIPNKQ
jgi:hypothetical protein